MLSWALAFFIVSVIAAIFGFTGVAAGAAEIAKIMFVVFVVLFLTSLVVGLLSSPVRRTPKPSIKDRIATLEGEMEAMRKRINEAEKCCGPIEFEVVRNDSYYTTAVSLRNAVSLLTSNLGLRFDQKPEQKAEIVLVKAKK